MLDPAVVPERGSALQAKKIHKVHTSFHKLALSSLASTDDHKSLER